MNKITFTAAEQEILAQAAKIESEKVQQASLAGVCDFASLTINSVGALWQAYKSSNVITVANPVRAETLPDLLALLQMEAAKPKLPEGVSVNEYGDVDISFTAANGYRHTLHFDAADMDLICAALKR